MKMPPYRYQRPEFGSGSVTPSIPNSVGKPQEGWPVVTLPPPALKGCICPTTSEQTCQADDCPRQSRKEKADRVDAELERLRKVLDAIANGDIPRTVAKQWRADGKPSKHDQCLHGAFMYEDCENCIADFARAALQEKRDD